MNANVVLILGNQHDDHVLHMHSHLAQLSVDVEVLDSRWFPQSMGLAFDPHSGIWQLELPSGRQIRSSQIHSVYWRTYDGIGAVSVEDFEQRFIAENDARSLFESFLIHLPAHWVNGWTAFQLHQTKPVQLALAAQLGLLLPNTRLTNMADQVQQLAAAHPSCIFKPVQGGDHARLLSLQHLSPANLESLRLAPITVQEAVPGTNIRVFLAGESIVACEIRTECIDYRDDPRPKLLHHELPVEIAEACRQLACKLHLLWSGIDFRLTPDGRYVFLEANPSPMFMGFEEATGLPLTQLLTQLLIDNQEIRTALI